MKRFRRLRSIRPIISRGQIQNFHLRGGKSFPLLSGRVIKTSLSVKPSRADQTGRVAGRSLAGSIGKLNPSVHVAKHSDHMKALSLGNRSKPFQFIQRVIARRASRV